MKILITGGLGHLGSHLVYTLPGHEITIVDDLSTQRYCSLFRLPENCKFIEGDFEDRAKELVQANHVVIHLAAVTDAASSFQNRNQIEETNIVKTKRLINAVAAYGKKLIFPSSTSVYGKAKDIMTEEDAGDPQSPYAESKLVIEDYIREVGVEHSILRLGTIFGVSKGMRFHTAINKFCYQAAYGIPLTVWRENYAQVRPYLSLEDMAQAIAMSIRCDLDLNNTYNVVSENYTLMSVIGLIKNCTPVEINFVDTPLINQYSYQVDCTKIRNRGFRPQTRLEEGITETLELLCES